MVTSSELLFKEPATLAAARRHAVLYGKAWLCDNWRLPERRLGSLTGAGLTLPQLSFQEPDGPQWFGVGEALRLSAYDEASALGLPDKARDVLGAHLFGSASAVALARFFGGVAAHPGLPPAPHWQAGEAAVFVLPALLLKQDDQGIEAVVILNVTPEDSEEALNERLRAQRRKLDSLLNAPRRPSKSPCGKRQDKPGDRSCWDSAVEAALEAFEQGRLEKVVLARAIEIGFDAPLEAWDLFATLSARMPTTYRFCFKLDAHGAFLGASPELLFAQTGTSLRADCLAGTVPRGATEEEDKLLGLSLLESAKDRHEHALVATMMRSALTPLTVQLSMPDLPVLRRLPNVQHLFTPVTGEWRPQVSLSDVLLRLHPTPAVCGTPRDGARHFIRNWEPSPRGWYAGAVGWVSLEDALFAVGIRSMTLQKDNARIMTGAGLVPGSTPEGEWNETERKAAPLLALLTGQAP
jgi:menaquinone-specific isochorismate synthase